MSDVARNLVQGAARARLESRLPDARRGLLRAVALYRQAGASSDLAHSVRHLGDLHLDLANAVRPLALLEERAAELDEAIRPWREARELYLQVQVQEGVAGCSEHLSRLGD